MNPFFLFPLALVTPIVLAACLFLPSYASIAGAAYIMYGAGAASNPLAEKWHDVFYMLEVYGQLLNHWLGNMQSLGVIDYAAPVVGLPALGIMFSLWLTWRIAIVMLNLFRLSASAN